MRPTRRFSIIISLALALASGLMLSSVAMAGGRPLTATLVGANERPVLGDPDGSGSFAATFNPGQGEVCYAYEVTGVEPLTAAHIHFAPAGVPGGVVIPTPKTSDTGGSGCVTADRDLIMAIIQNPSAYYFNVHNATYPGGALRGQLER
jgi:hypothetical protein